jgi:hypothetical protein
MKALNSAMSARMMQIAMKSGPMKKLRMMLWSYFRCMKKPTTSDELDCGHDEERRHEEDVGDARDVERGDLDGGDDREHHATTI